MFRINLKHLSIKIHFALLMAGISPFLCFGSSIAKQAGLSGNIIGLIYFLLPVITIFARIIMGIIGDKFNALKLILTVSMIISVLVFFVFLQYPPRHPLQQVTFFCNDRNTNVKFNDEKSVGKNSSITCKIKCSSDDNFFEMCSDWNRNASSNNTTNVIFCHLLSAKIEFYPQLNEKTPRVVNGTIEKVFNSYSEILLPHCFEKKNASCFVSCNEEITSIKSEILSPTFWYLFITFSLFGISYYVSCTSTDTICYQLLKDKPQAYGMQRAFGSFGWGISALLSGVLIDYFSDDDTDEKNYTPLYAFSLAIFIVGTLWSFTLKLDQQNKTAYNFKNVHNLFRRYQVVIFAFWAFMTGLYQQIIWQYSFWLLQDISSSEDLKWLKSLQGFLCVMSSIFGDLPFYLVSERVLKQISIGNCMSFVHFIIAMRFFIYSFLKIPLLAIPISTIDGISFGISCVLITSYSNKISASGTEATVQAVFNCIFDGVGSSVGGLCGGFLYDWFGGGSSFRILGYFASTTCFLHILFNYFKKDAFV